jgi:DNA helicase-2/ATP-dependent DNA helicase PcrA
MTLHSAKGLEFETVFLPGWEEGLFPHQRALDENGRAGLEEERRLAYVGLTRARRRAKLYFSSNRRIHGMWSSTIPSRFIDELPEDHVEVEESKGKPGWGGGTIGSRFDKVDPFSSSNYGTPGWQRARSGGGSGGGFAEDGARYGALERGRFGGSGRGAFGHSSGGKVIEGELVAKSTTKSTGGSMFARGDRVFHVKFGYGEITALDGNKLTVQFDKAGEKKVVDSFVQKV